MNKEARGLVFSPGSGSACKESVDFRKVASAGRAGVLKQLQCSFVLLQLWCVPCSHAGLGKPQAAGPYSQGPAFSRSEGA